MIWVMLATTEFTISSHLPKNVKIKIYKIIVLPVVLYRHKTWSLTLRTQTVYKNRVLRRNFILKTKETIRGSRNCKMMSLITLTLHQLG
jgi:hypothetical protein